MKKMLVIIGGMIVMVLVAKAVIPYFKVIPPEIIQHPDGRLHQVSTPVTEFDDELLKIVSELKEVTRKVDGFFSFLGLGMAAPQIGYNKRVVVLRRGNNDYQVMINPEVMERKWRFPSISGCYSTEKLHFLMRYFYYHMRYQDEEGEFHEEVIKGRIATVLQQELDHLNGILIND
jgi:peptide deformylase